MVFFLFETQRALIKCTRLARAFPAQMKRVPSEPGGTAGTTLGMRVSNTTTQATVLATSGGLSAQFPVFVGGIYYPVGRGIATDIAVHWVQHDHLKVLEGGVLANPVAVQQTQTPKATAGTLLSERLEIACGLEVVDTVALGLVIGAALGHWALAATTADAQAVDAVTLLSLVAEPPGLLGTCGPWAAGELVQLAELPSPHTQQEAHHIALLLAVDFLHILVGAHVEGLTGLCPRPIEEAPC